MIGFSNNKFVLMTLEEPVIIVASNVLKRICFSLMILKYFFIDGDDDERGKARTA